MPETDASIGTPRVSPSSGQSWFVNCPGWSDWRCSRPIGTPRKILEDGFNRGVPIGSWQAFASVYNLRFALSSASKINAIRDIGITAKVTSLFITSRGNKGITAIIIALLFYLVKHLLTFLKQSLPFYVEKISPVEFSANLTCFVVVVVFHKKIRNGWYILTDHGISSELCLTVMTYPVKFCCCCGVFFNSQLPICKTLKC